MRLFQCSFPEINDYSWARTDEKYRESYKSGIEQSDKELAARIAFIEVMGFDKPDKSGAALKGLVLTEKQIADCLLTGNLPTVERTIPIEDSLEGELIKFRTVVDKLHALPSLERAFNSKVEVHMPGQALATYNQTMLAENCCTDELQGLLDAGWRVIAACPQPDQRRPDYILGRFNPDHAVLSSGAGRNRIIKPNKAARPAPFEEHF